MTAPTHARLIAISGIDGSGKSTLAQGLRRVLELRGQSVRIISALKPTDSAPIRWMCELQLAPDAETVRQKWIAGYFVIVLSANVQQEILPALEAGAWVIADRWALDHQANQEAFGVDMTEWLPVLAGVARPGRHILLDLPVDVAMRRLAARNDDGIGQGRRFLTRARERMLELAHTQPGVAVINATAGERAVLAAAVKDLRLAATGGG